MHLKLKRKIVLKKFVVLYNIECVNPSRCGSNGVC